ncbi:MAG TPA: AAA family ATPase, partial [Planctomycetota bacterium]|nr:AAA family ATPase [Planctomycetota bacterium]
MSVVALTHLKGGVGKTTAAVNLAVLAARDGPTLLWDLDPQGAASFCFRVRPRTPVGAARLLRDDEAREDAIRGTDVPDLDLLPADFSNRKLDALLARSDARGRGLSRALQPLRESYRHVLLDGPPGISFLAESIFETSDLLLAPTPPTVLALRSLARLARHVAHRRGPPARLLPFLSMVDRRKDVHHRVVAWARAHGELVLRNDIPYASLIEAMGVQRAPLASFAAGSVPAQAFEALWREALARLREPAPDAARLADALDELLAGLDEVEAPAAAATPPRRAPAPAPTAGGREVEFKIALEGEPELAALLAALPAGAPEPQPPHEQLNHFFDTARGELRRAGLALRLREEAGRFVLTAKGAPAPGGKGVLTDRAEDEVALDGAWAFEVLGGLRSPLDVLAARLASGPTPLLAALRAAAGTRPLVRVGSFRNRR